jgi:hypothetical protein
MAEEIMATTLASMREEVQKAFVGRTDIDTLINQWLNDAQLMLATQLSIHEIECVWNLTFDIESGTTYNDTYAVPDDMWSPMIMRNTTQYDLQVPPVSQGSTMEIKYRPLEVIVKRTRTPAGKPDVFALRAGTFVFRPEPDAADVIELTGKRRPPTMTSGQAMLLPDEFKSVVVYDAIVRGLPIMQEEDRATTFVQLRNEELRKIGDQRGDEFKASLEGAVIETSGRDSLADAKGVRF